MDYAKQKMIAIKTTEKKTNKIHSMDFSSQQQLLQLPVEDPTTEVVWDIAYKKNYTPKYQKNTRNFSRQITGKPVDKPNIYIIPRVRTESYKDVELSQDDKTKVQYCPVSKGYSMQNVSSFTLGPVVGKGFSVVNVAFSRIIALKHIEGGGKVDLKRKNLWRRARKPTRVVELIDYDTISVDGNDFNIFEWLNANKSLWYDEWKLWSDSVALSYEGNFHWCDDTPTLAFCDEERLMGFVEWKKKCYIAPAYELFEKDNDVIKFLKTVYHDNKISLGLVHPKGKSQYAEDPITKELVEDLYNSTEMMCCMPYVVAGYLLGAAV